MNLCVRELPLLDPGIVELMERELAMGNEIILFFKQARAGDFQISPCRLIYANSKTGVVSYLHWEKVTMLFRGMPLERITSTSREPLVRKGKPWSEFLQNLGLSWSVTNGPGSPTRSD